MSRGIIVLLALCALGAAIASPVAAAPVNEDTVQKIAAQLRCVVCQSLSVADSPSETAQQMRGVIRDRLAAGETPEQIKAYFVDKYGLWPARVGGPVRRPSRGTRARGARAVAMEPPSARGRGRGTPRR